jgi:Protein of unknown function (DUF1541)
MVNKLVIGIISLTTVVALSACSGDKNEQIAENETTESQNVETTQSSETNMEGMDHSNMNHSGTGEVPNDLKEAKNPMFPVGTKSIIQADHMEGMNGAEATIVGAYNTIVYTISYTPTDGGEPVENHKYIIHEEIEEAGEEQFKPGDEVIINAQHMDGMDGVTAVIDTAEATTVYMVDYTSATGEQVTNHKWVTESELSVQ